MVLGEGYLSGGLLVEVGDGFLGLLLSGCHCGPGNDCVLDVHVSLMILPAALFKHLLCVLLPHF